MVSHSIEINGVRADRVEWYEFSFKDKYSGEVYLELTFYSNVSCRAWIGQTSADV
jgi:hypothetical protein